MVKDLGKIIEKVKKIEEVERKQHAQILETKAPEKPKTTPGVKAQTEPTVEVVERSRYGMSR